MLAIALTVEDVSLDEGSTLQLEVVGLDCDELLVEDLASSPDTTFASADPDVATVTDAGLVTAVADGLTTITARNEDLTARLTLTVLPVDPGSGGGIPGDGDDLRNMGARKTGTCGACGALGAAELLLIGLGLVALRQTTQTVKTSKR